MLSVFEIENNCRKINDNNKYNNQHSCVVMMQKMNFFSSKASISLMLSSPGKMYYAVDMTHILVKSVDRKDPQKGF